MKKPRKVSISCEQVAWHHECRRHKTYQSALSFKDDTQLADTLTEDRSHFQQEIQGKAAKSKSVSCKTLDSKLGWGFHATYWFFAAGLKSGKSEAKDSQFILTSTIVGLIIWGYIAYEFMLRS